MARCCAAWEAAGRTTQDSSPPGVGGAPGLGEVDPGAAPLAVGLGVTAFGGYSLLLSNKMTGGDVHPGESTGIHV